MIFSNTEFYYAKPELVSKNSIIITDEEAKHITKVMRHSVKDKIFITNGKGKIYNSIIKNITKKEVIAEYGEIFEQENKLKDVTFCIPVLKSKERLEFAFEKCIELGITNFIFFSAEKGYKRGIKFDRLNRIAISAMKQSLRSYKPRINYVDKLVFESHTNNIIFDQLSNLSFRSYLNKNKELINESINFIFGPEAGLTKKDKENLKSYKNYRLTNNRLRSETAIITSASILSTNMD